MATLKQLQKEFDKALERELAKKEKRISEKQLQKEFDKALESELQKKLDKKRSKRNAIPVKKNIRIPKRVSTFVQRDFGSKRKNLKKIIRAAGTSTNVPNIRKGRKLYVTKRLYSTKPVLLDQVSIPAIQQYFKSLYTRGLAYLITGAFLAVNRTGSKKTFERSIGRRRLNSLKEFFDYIDELFIYITDVEGKIRNQYGISTSAAIYLVGIVIEKISLRP